MAESEGRVIEEINLTDDDQNEVECLEDLVTLDGTDCTHDDMMDSSHGSQDDIVDITPPPEVLAEEKKAEGNAYYKVKDYRKALACYTRAIELCPDSVAYYGNRAACRMMMGSYQDALEDARESTRLDSSFAKGYVRIAKCCLALGDTAAALNAINKAEELDPNSDLANEKRSLHVLQQLGEEMSKANAKGDYRKVIYCCDRSLEHAPAARRLKLTKAECLALLSRYAEAEEMANDVLRLDQTNADALLVRGLCFYYQDNIERAFLHFKQVLLMAPDHAKARDIFRRAKLLKTKKEEGNDAFKAGRYQEAHELYTATLIIDPNNKLTNAKVYFNRAVVLVKLGKLKEALGDCDRAIELDETYIKAYLRRAKINMDLEQFEDAVRDYEKVNKMEKNRDYKRLLHEAKLALKKSQRKDYYKILGIDRNANDDEIKKAYKKRALVHHPDRHSSATEEEKKEQEKKFKELGEAYGILSDPKKKSRYDNGHDIDDNDGGGYSSEMDPNQIFQAFFGGPSMFRMSNMGGGMGGMGGGGMGGHCPGSFNFQFG